MSRYYLGKELAHVKLRAMLRSSKERHTQLPPVRHHHHHPHNDRIIIIVSILVVITIFLLRQYHHHHSHRNSQFHLCHHDRNKGRQGKICWINLSFYGKAVSHPQHRERFDKNSKGSLRKMERGGGSFEERIVWGYGRNMKMTRKPYIMLCDIKFISGFR